MRYTSIYLSYRVRGACYDIVEGFKLTLHVVYVHGNIFSHSHKSLPEYLTLLISEVYVFKREFPNFLN